MLYYYIRFIHILSYNQWSMRIINMIIYFINMFEHIYFYMGTTNPRYYCKNV